ncbi:MAG TPA: LysM peptidoglycan-binding domain-containing protein, partial [Gemmatimonadales bacterium]|nr:LysM peptidoglycan-binding domain-containing protein [Gemmatimonadales bacterium]
MLRSFLAVLVILVAACGGRGWAPPVSPTTAGSPLTGGSGPVTAHTTTATDSVPVPAMDPALLAADTAAELREAADSLADDAVLEELAEAHPEDAEAAGKTRGESVATEELANAVTWDIDVETFNSHARVQYYLDFFQGKGRERMGIWLTRMPRYEVMIRERLQRENLPGDLVYLALIESGFSNTATSRAKAVGMWQFMKATAKGYGLRVDSWVDERRDPFKATDAAVRHLRDLNRRFGSLYLAAAAYNAGSGKVSRGLRRLPSDDSDAPDSDATFFRLADTKLLRRETKDYVPKLIAAALIAKEPQRYGFRPGPAELVAYDSIVVPDMTGLDVIARLADTTVAAIRELNPQYLRLTTPPGKRSMIRIPLGHGPMTVAAYAELPPRQRVTFIEHFVGRGETLSGIAQRYRVSQSMLFAANPKVKSRALRIGQRIVVPTGGMPSTKVARRMAEPVVAAGTTPRTFHRVKRGETISELADEYGVSQRELLDWNRLDRKGRIRAGQRIRVSPPDARPASPPPPQEATPQEATPQESTGARTHIVRRGETLKGLARRYGVSIQALRTANGLAERETLKAGVAL